jgi:hypothetical protein
MSLRDKAVIDDLITTQSKDPKLMDILKRLSDAINTLHTVVHGGLAVSGVNLTDLPIPEDLARTSEENTFAEEQYMDAGITIPNNEYITLIDGIGTPRRGMQVNTVNQLFIGDNTIIPHIPTVPNANIPDASFIGLLCIDLNNNRLVFIVGGSRWYINPDGTF